VLTGKDSIEVSIELSNKSDIPCKETVQLFLSDDYASLIPCGKTLKRFHKISIPANGVASLKFYLNKSDLKFVGKDGDFVVEDGSFSIRIGNLEKKFDYKNE
jgi:beta-glucosidase